ncbi:hypothetical protein ACFQWA_28000 [Streptomyces thermogriseus]|uniref:hypothetical protein n=1 Tax=Streptomyces thermogriseus TaxID=75292 RepID=UPI003615EA9B
MAERLVGDMQRVGFRMADMPGHIEGLTAGYVLASEEGYEFRVIANPECRA